VNIIRIVEWLGAAPDDGEGHGDVGRPGRVGELGVVAVDSVGEESGIYAGHTTFDVELTYEASLNDELLEKKKVAFSVAGWGSPRV
jgi:hypothetical protein